jgi:hypothetical protein
MPPALVVGITPPGSGSNTHPQQSRFSFNQSPPAEDLASLAGVTKDAVDPALLSLPTLRPRGRSRGDSTCSQPEEQPMPGLLQVSPAMAHPSQNINVRWSLPLHLVPSTLAKRADQQLTVGLFRFGHTRSENDKAITTRHALPQNHRQLRQQMQQTPHGQAFARSIPFHAPRAVGIYEFRLYYAHRPMEILAVAEPALSVEVQSCRNVEEQLGFIRSRLKGDTCSSALLHLQRVLQQIHGQVQPQEGRNVAVQLQKLMGWDGTVARELWATVEPAQAEAMKQFLSSWRKNETAKAKEAAENGGVPPPCEDEGGGRERSNSMAQRNGELVRVRWPLVSALRSVLDLVLALDQELQRAGVDGGEGGQAAAPDAQAAQAAPGAPASSAPCAALLTPERRRLVRGWLVHVVLAEGSDVELSEAFRSREAENARMGRSQLGAPPLLGTPPEGLPVLADPASLRQGGGSGGVQSPWLRGLEDAFWGMARSVMPGPEFIRNRLALRARLQEYVRELALPPWIFPGGSASNSLQLETFGSSRNTFGGESSDMDMALLLPKWSTAGSPRHRQEPGAAAGASAAGEASAGADGSDGDGDGDDDKSELEKQLSEPPSSEMVIDALSELLTSYGMLKVEARRTARIPIIMFTDPSSNLECDICLQNLLALRNTEVRNMYTFGCALLATPTMPPLPSHLPFTPVLCSHPIR